MLEDIKKIVSASIAVKQKLLGDENLLKTTSRVVEVIVNAFKDGKRVYFAGNGGSAADAQHLAAEFSGRFYMDRHALPAEALHCNTSYLTAVANDYSFDEIYARLIRSIAHPGDVLVGSELDDGQHVVCSQPRPSMVSMAFRYFSSRL